MVGALLAACNPATTKQPAPAFAVECEITALALRAEATGDRPWILTADPIGPSVTLTEQFILQSFPGEDLDEDDWRWFFVPDGSETAERAEAPSAAMARAFVKAEKVDGGICPSVREFAAQAGALPDGQPPPPALTETGLFQVDRVTVQRAVVSPDGTEALLAMSTISGPHAGSGMLIRYQKAPDGRWRETGRLGLWVS